MYEKFFILIQLVIDCFNKKFDELIKEIDYWEMVWEKVEKDGNEVGKNEVDVYCVEVVIVCDEFIVFSLSLFKFVCNYEYIV